MSNIINYNSSFDGAVCVVLPWFSASMYRQRALTHSFSRININNHIRTRKRSRSRSFSCFEKRNFRSTSAGVGYPPRSCADKRSRQSFYYRRDIGKDAIMPLNEEHRFLGLEL